MAWRPIVFRDSDQRHCRNRKAEKKLIAKTLEMMHNAAGKNAKNAIPKQMPCCNLKSRIQKGIKPAKDR